MCLPLHAPDPIACRTCGGLDIPSVVGNPAGSNTKAAVPPSGNRTEHPPFGGCFGFDIRNIDTKTVIRQLIFRINHKKMRIRYFIKIMD